MPTNYPLPVVASDNNIWGGILNDFLLTSIADPTVYSYTYTSAAYAYASGTLNVDYTNPQTGSTNYNLATSSYPGLILLGGDLGNNATGGTPPAWSPTVVGLQGHGVSSTAPTSNQVLQYTSGAWTPTSYSGDVSGNPGSSTVVAIQGKPVSSATPSNGNVLEYVSGTWTPSAISSGTQRTFAFFAG
ncbi:MAG TPA: hypothetical protein VGF75_07380 [Candidatus Saccharimonadales bacterium]|jgi:hypothetical protein